jgi:predicted enzyme related to lactoylglutathione lyase
MQQNRTPGSVAHFAINADDVEASRAFYESSFGWTFKAWGPPGFYLIDTGTAPGGALQQRRDLVPGVRTAGFECTIAVEDVAATLAAVKSAGGTVVLEPVNIPTVGELAFFADPAGNVVGVMKYEPGA